MSQINRLRLSYALHQLRGLWERVPTHAHKRTAAVERRIGL